jgi:hypothetical protein
MMNKKIIGVAVVIVILGGLWWMKSSNVEAPTENNPASGELLNQNSAQTVEQDLNAIDANANLDADFQSADKDLKTL